MIMSIKHYSIPGLPVALGTVDEAVQEVLARFFTKVVLFLDPALGEPVEEGAVDADAGFFVEGDKVKLYDTLSRIFEISLRSVGGQAGKRAWADAANECYCLLYLRACCKD
jgi:hypothetical protein